MNNKPLIDKWVANYMAVFLTTMFGGVIFVSLGIAWNQIVWHFSEPTSYASEFVGIINSVISFGLGVFFGSVISKLLGIRNDDMQKNVDQAVRVSKQVGLSAVAEQHDKLQESPEVDNENN